MVDKYKKLLIFYLYMPILVSELVKVCVTTHKRRKLVFCMKIWGNTPKILGVYDKQKNINKSDKTSDVSAKKDVISISNQAKDFQTVLKALKDIPDVRNDKVNELAARIDAGDYEVSGTDIADKIVKSVFDKKV